MQTSGAGRRASRQSYTEDWRVMHTESHASSCSPLMGKRIPAFLPTHYQQFPNTQLEAWADRVQWHLTSCPRTGCQQREYAKAGQGDRKPLFPRSRQNRSLSAVPRHCHPKLHVVLENRPPNQPAHIYRWKFSSLKLVKFTGHGGARL